MSSAILYLAIIAIWLCVLIPRWLKRDSARGAVIETNTMAGDETPVTGQADSDQAELADDGVPPAAEPGVTGRPAAAPAPPLSAEEARRRILTGRRRLLGMLILLEIAAIALAVVGLAALWVIIPPTIMLSGYLLLLREAAHADAERAKREAEAAAHQRERAARGQGAGSGGPARHPGRGHAHRLNDPRGAGGRGRPRRQVRRRPGPGRLRGLGPGLRARAGGQVHHLERRPRADGRGVRLRSAAAARGRRLASCRPRPRRLPCAQATAARPRTTTARPLLAGPADR